MGRKIEDNATFRTRHNKSTFYKNSKLVERFTITEVVCTKQYITMQYFRNKCKQKNWRNATFTTRHNEGKLKKIAKV